AFSALWAFRLSLPPSASTAITVMRSYRTGKVLALAAYSLIWRLMILPRNSGHRGYPADGRIAHGVRGRYTGNGTAPHLELSKNQPFSVQWFDACWNPFRLQHVYR